VPSYDSISATVIRPSERPPKRSGKPSSASPVKPNKQNYAIVQTIIDIVR
jgi:hypothetical protein